MSKQSEGGKARAAKLTPEKRTDIARKAAKASWEGRGGQFPKETHPGEVPIGEGVLICSVLSDGTRVFSGRSLSSLMGSKRRGGTAEIADVEVGDSGVAVLPRFLAIKSIISHIPNDLMARLSVPIQYQPKHRGRTGFGYEATILPEICAAIIDAKDAGDLPPNRLPMAAVATMLLRAFAKVGVIAVIDEATGYQAERDKDELQQLLKLYLSEEALKWMKAFPAEFFNQIYRLRGWKRPLQLNAHSPFMGRIINELVYDRLPPGVHEELRKKNPKTDDTGYRKYKHHQFLTQDIGHPHLQSHLQKIIVLMQISRSWEEFKQVFGRAFFPDAGDQPTLGLEEDPVTSST